MSLTILTTSRIWTALGWTMLHFIWVGLVVGLVAALGRRLAKRASPELRYGLALVCLAALAGSPILIFVRVFEPSAPAGVVPVGVVEKGQTARGGSDSSWENLRPAKFDSQGLSVLRPMVRLNGWNLDSVVPYLPWFWLCGSVSTLLMLATGLIGVEQLRRSSRVLESGEIPGRVRALADSLGIARRVSIGVCERLAVPVLMGIVRPMILVPPAALCGWSVEQLEMVLLHELAHLRRWDNLVNLVQRIVESLLFFHPATWWLSGWVRIERELCCDRLVVDRVGQPYAYAELLMSLSGSSHRVGGAVLAMADGQVSMRIRRLLNVKERSMRLTMSEGLGALGAVIVGVSLLLASHAGQPQPARESMESVQQAFREAADQVAIDQKAGPRDRGTLNALTSIAQAQMKLGDRASALATLERANESIADPANSLVEMVMMARYQRQAGDLAAARRSLERVTKLTDTFKFRTSGISTPEKVNDNSYSLCEMLARIAEERIELGDRDEARVLARRALAAIQPYQGPHKLLALGYVAGRLFKAGDMGGARDAIAQARRIGVELPESREKRRGMIYIAESLCEIGDVDEAISMSRSFGESGLQSALKSIALSYCDEPYPDGLDPVPIRITVGAESWPIRDQAAARRDLPKIAQAVRQTGTRLFQARTLALIAHLQAKAGDFGGSLQTVETIPNVVRKDFPGPVDGQYDAIKPIILAMIAHSQAEIGDMAGARQTIFQALSLARTIETVDQKLVALVVIARKQIDCGEQVLARTLIDEAFAFALTQPEPRRSRCLAMLSETDVKAGDVAGATGILEAIRDNPGFEKQRALQIVADWHQKHGDQTAAQTFYRRALQLTLMDRPENAKPLANKPQGGMAISAISFVDPDVEVDPRLAEILAQRDSMLLRVRLGDSEGAIRQAQAMPDPLRNGALSNLAETLAHHGQVAMAIKLAASLDTAQDRLRAYDLVASAVRDGRERE